MKKFLVILVGIVLLGLSFLGGYYAGGENKPVYTNNCTETSKLITGYCDMDGNEISISEVKKVCSTK